MWRSEDSLYESGVFFQQGGPRDGIQDCQFGSKPPSLPELAISMAPNIFLMSFFLLLSLKEQGKSGISNNNLQE